MRKLLLNPTPLFRKLRQLSMLLTLLLVPLGALGQTITVAGLTPDDQTGAIAGANITGTVSFDSKTNTLTLTNATINGNIAWTGAGNNPHLTIQMSGKNSVNGSIESTNTAATCSLHIKRIDNAESATLKYTGSITGFITDSETGFKQFDITDGNTTYHYYTTAAVYELMVGGIQVHNIEGELGYKDNIFQNDGTPTATFDGTNILTLNDVTITPEGDVCGIKYTGTTNFTISLNGSNTVKGSGGCNAILYENVGVTTPPTLTFINGGTEPCSLQLEAANTQTIGGFGSVINTGLYKIEETITGNEGTTYKTTITSTILSGGSGTPDDPFIIKTTDDLKNFARYINDGTIGSSVSVKLSDDISESGLDCSSLTVQPIGIEGNANAGISSIYFSGIFDGNNKTIKNLSITGDNGEYVGIFRSLTTNGKIENLILDNITISGGGTSSNDIGGLVGYMDGGTISGCTIKNSSISCLTNTSQPSVGGFVGHLGGGTISNSNIVSCVVKAETSSTGVSSPNAIGGGIAGTIMDGTVSGCRVKGTTAVSANHDDVDASVYAGALIGNKNGGTFSDNTYEYTVTATAKTTTKSGYTQRGIGNGNDVSTDNGAVMYTKIVSLPSVVSATGTVVGVEGTYYRVDGTSLYVAPGQTAKINATPNTANNFALAWLQAVNISSTDVVACDSTSITGGGRQYTFTMPDTQVNIDVHFAIDLSADGITATIDDAFYTGEALEPTTLKVEGMTGAAGVTNLTKGTDFTITGYTKGGVAVDAPVDAGDYIVQIEGKGNYIGTKNVSYKIWQTYALTIAGTQINENNAANVFGSAGTATVSFTPATESNPTNTLTLNAYQNNSNAAIVSSLPNLTIVINGESSIGDNSGTDGFIQSTNANATLTFKKGSDNSTLTLHASNDDAVVQGFASVSYDETYYSYSSSINYNTSAKRYESRYGQLQLLTITTVRHYPIWVEAVQVSDDNKNNLASGCATFTPGTDTTPNTLLLNGASILSMTAIESDLDNLTISLIGDNTLSTNYNGYNPIYSFNPDAELIIKQAGDADCTLGLSTTGQDPVIKGFKSVSHKSVTDTPLYFVSKTGATLDGATTYDAVLSSATIYPLWIDGTMVTEANKNAILGAGNTKVTYDGDTNNGGTNTLTLNKYSYTGNAADGHAIETNITGLKVKLVGENTINCENNSKYDSNYAFYTYLSTASIQFVKDDATSKLTLQTTPANPFGGFADGKITYDGLVYYSEGTYIAVPTAPTMAEDNNKVKLTINYSGGNVAIKYSIDYADETADVTEATYSEPFAMAAPGTVEAWVEANGATTENDKVKGKYFGYKDAPFTLKADLVDHSKSETLMPVMIPAFVDGENIALKTTGTYESSAEGVATFTGGTITAVGIGKATVTANIDYTGDVQPVVILNHEKKVTAEVNVGVTPSITFTPDMKYATFCNTGNKDLTVPEGLTAYAITGVNGTVVTLAQVEFLPKVNGTTYFPLLLKREDKNTEVGLSLEYDGTASTLPSNQLKYAISDVSTTGVEFVLYKDEFVKATGTIRANKCYLDLNGVVAPARSLGIDSDGTTDIHEIDVEDEESREEWYDLQGRRIQQPTKAGLYIKNGKKVIVNTK